jgi:AraC family cel operon transcriptional repressor
MSMIQYTFPNDTADLTFNYNHAPWTEAHTHTFWEIMLITDGDYIHKINGHSHHIKKNTLCLIRPNDKHSIHGAKKLKSAHINICIQDSLIKKQLSLFNDAMYAQLLAPDIIEIEVPSNISQYTLESIYRLQTLDRTELLYQNLLSLLFLDLFRTIIHDLITRNHTNEKNYIKPVQVLVELMSDPKNIHLSVEDICRISNFSHSYLIKVFKKHLNTTPNEYFRKIKMNYARSQLESTMLSIAHISSNIGINNVCHFNTAFKRIFNITPGQYRKKWHLYYNSFLDVK